MAQEATAEDEADAAATIVVTGSRIARRDYEASSPIVSVGEDLLKNTGTSAVESALNKLPAFTPVQTPSNGTDIQATATNTPVPPATSTPTSTPTPTGLPSDLIFAHSFESGTLAGWSSSSTNGGKLSVSQAAALAGTWGMQAQIGSTAAMYCVDTTPAAERTYRARFYFSPNGVSTTQHDLLVGRSGSGTTIWQVQLRKSGGAYQVRGTLRTNSGGSASTSAIRRIETARGTKPHHTSRLAVRSP